MGIIVIHYAGINNVNDTSLNNSKSFALEQ